MFCVLTRNDESFHYQSVHDSGPKVTPPVSSPRTTRLFDVLAKRATLSSAWVAAGVRIADQKTQRDWL